MTICVIVLQLYFIFLWIFVHAWSTYSYIHVFLGRDTNSVFGLGARSAAPLPPVAVFHPQENQGGDIQSEGTNKSKAREADVRQMQGRRWCGRGDGRQGNYWGPREAERALALARAKACRNGAILGNELVYYIFHTATGGCIATFFVNKKFKFRLSTFTKIHETCRLNYKCALRKYCWGTV